MKIIISASSGNSLVNFRGNLIKSMSKRGHQVICMSCEKEEIIEEAIHKLGASYQRVNLSRTGTNPFFDILTFFSYLRILKNHKPDLYFAYMSKPVAYGGLAARINKVPHINILVTGLEIAFYSNGFKNLVVKNLLVFLFKRVHKSAENIFFQNPDDLITFSELGVVNPQKTTIVNGSGVDLTFFTQKPLPKSPVILMIARLVWSKGIREFLEAAARIHIDNPNAEIMLVGGLDSNPESLTKNELEQNILKSNIKYIGQVEDVRPYLERCSIFVLPSYHEGTPRSVLEAMAVGRPIITTDAPGCRETVIDGYNGFLVPVMNSTVLYEKMRILVEDSKLRERMANNSFKICKDKYDVNLVNKILLEKMGL